MSTRSTEGRHVQSVTGGYIACHDTPAALYDALAEAVVRRWQRVALTFWKAEEDES